MVTSFRYIDTHTHVNLRAFDEDRDEVREENQRQRQEEFLRPPVAAARDDIPDQDRRQRHAHIAADAENLRSSRDADEFADRDGCVRYEQRQRASG